MTRWTLDGDRWGAVGVQGLQELTPDTARHDVIVRRGVERDELAAGHGHGGMVRIRACGLR